MEQTGQPLYRRDSYVDDVLCNCVLSVPVVDETVVLQKGLQVRLIPKCEFYWADTSL